MICPSSSSYRTLLNSPCCSSTFWSPLERVCLANKQYCRAEISCVFWQLLSVLHFSRAESSRVGSGRDELSQGEPSRTWTRWRLSKQTKVFAGGTSDAYGAARSLELAAGRRRDGAERGLTVMILISLAQRVHALLLECVSWSPRPLIRLPSRA